VGNYELYGGGLVFQAFAHHNTSHDGHDHSAASPLTLTNGACGPQALDVVAVGGRYDSLIARFVAPNSKQTAISAVGMNLAIEKIIASIISQVGIEQPKTVQARRVRTRELSRGTENQSSVLLFCTRGALLSERARIASELWEDNIPARKSDTSAAALRIGRRSDTPPPFSLCASVRVHAPEGPDSAAHSSVLH
jgi:histidyl-tRNA synthetase